MLHLPAINISMAMSVTQNTDPNSLHCPLHLIDFDGMTAGDCGRRVAADSEPFLVSASSSYKKHFTVRPSTKTSLGTSRLQISMTAGHLPAYRQPALVYSSVSTAARFVFPSHLLSGSASGIAFLSVWV